MLKWFFILLFVLYLIGCIWLGLNPGKLDDVDINVIVNSMRTML